MEIDLVNSNLKAIIDIEDRWLVQMYSWSLRTANHLNYAVTARYGRQIAMHRLILGLGVPTLEADHRSGDGLDNRRQNLRIVTHAQQMQNRKVHKNSKSGVRGVCWQVRDKCWRARVILNGEAVFYQNFKDFDAACIAVVAARKQHLTHSIERVEH